MRAAFDADILSTFARIKRLDLLNSLFERVVVPGSAVSELGRAEIGISGLKHEIAKLTREELVSLSDVVTSLGRGERRLCDCEAREHPPGEQ